MTEELVTSCVSILCGASLFSNHVMEETNSSAPRDNTDVMTIAIAIHKEKGTSNHEDLGQFPFCKCLSKVVNGIYLR